MITKDDLLESALHEIRVTKQLLTQVPDGGWDYRPSPEQRSTLELARYLCRVGQGCAMAAQDGSFKWLQDTNERFEALTPDAVPAALDEQAAHLERIFASISDEDFRTREISVEGMGDATLRRWLLDTTLKFLTAYKLQLFLYLKAAGATHLDTMDCWRRDGTPEPAQA